VTLTRTEAMLNLDILLCILALHALIPSAVVLATAGTPLALVPGTIAAAMAVSLLRAARAREVNA
jgi:hypothetical protein